MSTILEFPERSDVVTEALTWPQQARAFSVVDGESYSRGATFLKAIKALRQKIAETFDPHCKRAFDAHRALVKEKADAEAPLTEAERIIKNGLLAYDQEQERLRREEQQRLEREAREQEETARLNQAAAMETEGNEWGDPALVREAHELLDQPIYAPPVAAVAKATPKVSGITYRTTYAAKVVNLHELVKFVAANPSHIGLLSANVPALNMQARSLKEAMRIPGVQVVPTRDVAAGAR